MRVEYNLKINWNSDLAPKFSDELAGIGLSQAIEGLSYGYESGSLDTTLDCEVGDGLFKEIEFQGTWSLEQVCPI